jgi:hypothetical protein
VLVTTAVAAGGTEADIQEHARRADELTDIWIEHRLLRQRPKRSQMEYMAAVMMWRDRSLRAGGDPDGDLDVMLDRTYRQLQNFMAPYVGWPRAVSRQDVRAYRTQIRATIGFLTELKYLGGRRARLRSSGEGRCIVVAVPAGVAQSVRAAES